MSKSSPSPSLGVEKKKKKPEDPRIVQPTTSEKDQGEVSEELNKKKADGEEREKERKQREKGKSIVERPKFEPRPPFPQRLAQ